MSNCAYDLDKLLYQESDLLTNSRRYFLAGELDSPRHYSDYEDGGPAAGEL